jgi:superfamily II DNA or RNA helicase
MADRLNKSGISSMELFGESSADERNSTKRKLVNGEVKSIFTIDLYNEGVEIPEVNTLLF